MTRILGPGLYERFPCPEHGINCVQTIYQTKRQIITGTRVVDETTRSEKHHASETGKRRKKAGGSK